MFLTNLEMVSLWAWIWSFFYNSQMQSCLSLHQLPNTIFFPVDLKWCPHYLCWWCSNIYFQGWALSSQGSCLPIANCPCMSQMLESIMMIESLICYHHCQTYSCSSSFSVNGTIISAVTQSKTVSIILDSFLFSSFIFDPSVDWH